VTADATLAKLRSMNKTFRPYTLDQHLLLPPDMREWLPEGDLALFISDVVDELDLSAIYRAYDTGDGRGQPPYHPAMMVKLLVYAYCTGLPSARKIERATYRDVAFRVLAADQHPDHDSLAEFRKRHLSALAGLFVQVLQLCHRAGLVKLGHVALDGTKVKANASKHKAMSYGRMEETERRLEQEVQALLRQAEQVDAAEDVEYGPGRRGDELPAELARRESRLGKIRAAKAALEAEAKAQAAETAESGRAKLAAREQRVGSAKGGGPKIPDPEQARPAPTAQRNFTDPDSRIMKDGATKSFEQAYNAQAAVDGPHQIIVACGVTQAAADVRDEGDRGLGGDLGSCRLSVVATAEGAVAAVAAPSAPAFCADSEAGAADPEDQPTPDGPALGSAQAQGRPSTLRAHQARHTSQASGPDQDRSLGRAAARLQRDRSGQPLRQQRGR